MTNEEVQSIMNSTFSGLAMFCKDLELDEELIALYQPNQIIMERGFTDLSHKVSGISKNCRYLVASSKGKDLSMFSQNPEFGHIVIQSGAFYKVLDIQKENGKTQILLLNIPEEGVPIFASSKINIEDQVIEKGIEVFKRTLKATPLKELQSKDWLDRTSFPIGMSKEGVFFLNMNMNSKPEATSKPSTESPAKQPLNKDESTKQKTDTPPPNKNMETKKPKAEKKGFWNKLFGK